eukprot:3935666-Rhodomonas_salina.2
MQYFAAANVDALDRALNLRTSSSYAAVSAADHKLRGGSALTRAGRCWDRAELPVERCHVPGPVARRNAGPALCPDPSCAPEALLRLRKYADPPDPEIHNRVEGWEFA